MTRSQTESFKYFAEGIVFDQVISFEDFPNHCTKRLTGYQRDIWSLEFKGYPVSPLPENKGYRISLNGFVFAFNADHAVLVAEPNKILVRNKEIIDTFKIKKDNND